MGGGEQWMIATQRNNMQRDATPQYTAMRHKIYLVVLVCVQIVCTRYGPSKAGGKRIKLLVLTPTAIFGILVRTTQVRLHERVDVHESLVPFIDGIIPGEGWINERSRQYLPTPNMTQTQPCPELLSTLALTSRPNPTLTPIPNHDYNPRISNVLEFVVEYIIVHL